MSRSGEQRQVLALEGKTARGAHIPSDSSGTGGYRQPHRASVLDQASRAVLGQVTVDAKGSEVGAFTILLDDLDLTDVLITPDAVHTKPASTPTTCTNVAATTC